MTATAAGWVFVAFCAMVVSYGFANEVPVTKRNINATLILWVIAVAALLLAALSSL